MTYTSAINATRQGKQDGFRYLYESTYRDMYYIARKYMGNEADAEDVLREAYDRAWKRISDLQEAERCPSWLSMIVANTALDALKEKRHQPKLFIEKEGEDEEGEVCDYEIADFRADAQPEMKHSEQETSKMVRILLETLSDEQRMCVLMHYMEGIPLKEVALQMGCSQNAIKSRLYHARQNLKSGVETLGKKEFQVSGFTPLCILHFLIEKEKSLIHGIPAKSMVVSGITGPKPAATPSDSAEGGVFKAVGETTGKRRFLASTAGKIAFVVIAACVVGVAIIGGILLTGRDSRNPTKDVELTAGQTGAPSALRDESKQKATGESSEEDAGGRSEEVLATSSSTELDAGWYIATDYDSAETEQALIQTGIHLYTGVSKEKILEGVLNQTELAEAAGAYPEDIISGLLQGEEISIRGDDNTCIRSHMEKKGEEIVYSMEIELPTETVKGENEFITLEMMLQPAETPLGFTVVRMEAKKTFPDVLPDMVEAVGYSVYSRGWSFSEEYGDEKKVFSNEDLDKVSFLKDEIVFHALYDYEKSEWIEDGDFFGETHEVDKEKAEEIVKGLAGLDFNISAFPQGYKESAREYGVYYIDEKLYVYMMSIGFFDAPHLTRMEYSTEEEMYICTVTITDYSEEDSEYATENNPVVIMKFARDDNTYGLQLRECVLSGAEW